MTIIIILFAALMFAGAVNAVFKGGENEGICKYGYIEEDSNNEENK